MALTVLFLAACSSGGIGDILGGGTSNQSQELRGTVEAVDTSTRSIYLTNVSGYQSMLSSGGSSGAVRVYYDANTTVSFNGQSYRPEDLERGDEVAVRVDESDNRLTADSMTVLRDSSSGTTTGGSYPSYGTTLMGTVAYVDASRRTIEIDRTSGANVIVEFETNTPVYYNNQTYRPADLERGDEVEIRYSDLGSNRVLARDITVTRNVSGGTFGGGGTSTQSSTVRGTVRYHDTSRRTIEIDSASWISGFNSGAGTGTRYVISYDTNARVDVSGTLQPVSGLEQGDVIEVQVSNPNSSTLYAQRIFLVRDVRR